jgi:DNA polymerase III subunit epsilon
LIYLPSLEFDAATTRIHGIKAEYVWNAKRFDEVWEDIKHYFSGTTVIAHNAQIEEIRLFSGAKMIVCPECGTII